MNLRNEIIGVLARHMPANADGEFLGQVADEILAKVKSDTHGRYLDSTLEHLRDSPSSEALAQRAAEHLAGQDTQVP